MCAWHPVEVLPVDLHRADVIAEKLEVPGALLLQVTDGIAAQYIEKVIL